MSRCDRGKRTGNSVPGSGNSMDHGLEWAESGPDESLKGGWGGWSPGGADRRTVGWQKVLEREGDQTPPEPIGRVTECPPGVNSASFFSPVFPVWTSSYSFSFFMKHWGIWLSRWVFCFVLFCFTTSATWEAIWSNKKKKYSDFLPNCQEPACNSHWKLVMEDGGQPPRLRAENESEVQRERNPLVYLSLQ